MGSVTKLHRSSVDDTLDDAAQAELVECVIIGKNKDGEIVAYYSDSATCETLAISGLLLQHDAVHGLIHSE